MSMNFRVTDGSVSYYDDFPCFVELYRDSSVSVTKIREELCLSPGKYKNYLERAIDDGLVEYRRREFNNYHFSDGFFNVQKYLNGRMVYFGRYATEEDARFVVSELKKCGWNKACLNEIKSRLL